MTAMAHLTCAAHTRAELVEIVARYRDAGIENILALGGDPPKDLDLPPGELHYAVELVRADPWRRRLLGRGRRAPRAAPALAELARPIGVTPPRSSREADFAITQFFFDAAHYFDLVESLRALGVDKPVIAGHHAGHEPRQRSSGWRSCRARSSRRGSPRSCTRSATTRRPYVRSASPRPPSCARALLAGGAPGLHFYTLNRSTATREIYENLGWHVSVREG